MLLTARAVATPVACKTLVHAMARIVEPETVAETANGANAPDALVATSVAVAGIVTIGCAAAPAVHNALQKEKQQRTAGAIATVPSGREKRSWYMYVCMRESSNTSATCWWHQHGGIVAGMRVPRQCYRKGRRQHEG